MRWAKKAMSSSRSFKSVAARTALRKSSASVGEVAQVRKGDLRLDHPKLRQVAAGVGVFGAERGAEGIDLGEGQAIGLEIELAGDGEEGLAAEEVVRQSRPDGMCRPNGPRRRAC